MSNFYEGSIYSFESSLRSLESAAGEAKSSYSRHFQHWTDIKANEASTIIKDEYQKLKEVHASGEDVVSAFKKFANIAREVNLDGI